MTAERDPIFEPITIGRHVMPGAWRYMLPEDFSWLKLPDERQAKCQDCRMVKLGKFHAESRCCTHFPEIANFMIGLGLLSDSRPALEELIAARQALPFGLVPSPWRYRKTITAYGEDRFGNKLDIRCPLIDAKTLDCRVYPVRNSVCSTFHCHNQHGKVGSEFWDRMQNLVAQVEAALSQWCMDELGVPHQIYCDMLDAMSTRVEAMSEEDSLAWSPEYYEDLWGPWHGRELDFYKACAELAMHHREQLWNLAREQPGRDALVYDRAVIAFVPEEHREHAELTAEENTDTRPIDDDWYLVQASAKRMWALPFQDGPVEIHPNVEIIDNPRDDGLCRDAPEPFMICSRDQEVRPSGLRELMNADEAALLRVFTEPQEFGEALFERPEFEALEQGREFLSQCLRLEVLRLVPKTPAKMPSLPLLS